MKRYSFAWVTGLLFLVTLVLHWWFGWYAFADEASQHGQAPQMSGYMVEMMRDTMENWQSEFLQLVWQVAGLSFLYFAGSPGSRGDDERMEAKLDALLRDLDREKADRLIRQLDEKYPGRDKADTQLELQ